MQLELLEIRYRFLGKPTNILVIVATSKEYGSSEYEGMNIEVVIERSTKEELFNLSLLEIRQEAIERAKALMVAVE
ncbi:MAG: hypothetical protein KME59_25580 [Trichormus sp. ATA11-4-KO1]|jgi:hypothetical protein|nr:hypothetical protein [Trichormus sp. ATA11-4-KO1]